MMTYKIGFKYYLKKNVTHMEKYAIINVNDKHKRTQLQ